ncbi:MAG: short-subunit dehydrogenase [Candidatus Latescibacterota bacterium]|jgi:short-subunit dehydrogenase
MKHVVITGAASGIGKALAYRFSKSGYKITGIDIDTQRAQEIERDLNANCIIADLSSQNDLSQAIQQLIDRAPIDIFIHNAGINAVGHFQNLPTQDQERVIAINLTAPMQITAALLKAKKIQQKGSLVFISSLSHQVSYPGASAYAASKSGLSSYARSLSVALAPQNIHTLTVYPGPTRTEHAQRHSPDNTREHKRMPPEKLAHLIYRAVQTRKRILIPGLGNQLFATLGLYFPRLTETLMRKMIYDKL